MRLRDVAWSVLTRLSFAGAFLALLLGTTGCFEWDWDLDDFDAEYDENFYAEPYDDYLSGGYDYSNPYGDPYSNAGEAFGGRTLLVSDSTLAGTIDPLKETTALATTSERGLSDDYYFEIQIDVETSEGAAMALLEFYPDADTIEALSVDCPIVQATICTGPEKDVWDYDTFVSWPDVEYEFVPVAGEPNTYDLHFTTFLNRYDYEANEEVVTGSTRLTFVDR